MGRTSDTPCLTLGAIERIVGGASSSAELPEVADHLAACRVCQAAIKRARDNEHFLSRIRGGAADQSGATVFPPIPPQDDGSSPSFDPALSGYQILREIRRGGQGAVYEGIRLSTKQRVAIKVLHQRSDRDWNQRMRFDREVSALVKLQHPGIVRIQDCGLVNGRPFLVMDFVLGSTLDEYAAKRIPLLAERIAIFCEICEAVHFAHLRGVIHRDLKPNNVLVDEHGRPRLIDFGLAKILHDSDTRAISSSTMQGQFFGSLPWASPEQARGDAACVDLRSDVYSLGAILYELATKQLPISPIGSFTEIIRKIIELEPAVPSSINHSIAGDLDTIILTCLQKDPDHRYQSVSELLRDLRRYQHDEPIEARRDSTWRMIRRSLRRNRIALVVVTSVATALLAAGAVLALSRENARAVEKARQAAAFSEMALQLATPDETRLRTRVRNLAPLFAYLQEFPDSEGAVRVRQRLADEGKALAAKIRTAIDSLDADDFIELIAEDVNAWTLLSRCLASDTAGALPALAVFLEQTLLTPPAAGRAAWRERHLQALRRLAPERAAADQAQKAIDGLIGTMSPIYVQSFDKLDVGIRPGEWQTTFSNSEIPYAVAGPQRMLLVGSNSTTAGSIRHAFNANYASLKLGLSFRIAPLAESGAANELNGHVKLLGGSGDSDGGHISVSNGRFRCSVPIGETRKELHYGPQVVAGRAYRLEIWYFRDRSTWDCTIDGKYLVEEAPIGSSVEPQAIELNAAAGCEIRVDDIELTGTNEIMKRPLGDARCKESYRELPLTPVVFWPGLGMDAIWTDVNQDGRAELVAGSVGASGVIEAYQVDPTRLTRDLILRHEIRNAEVVAPQFAVPKGVVAAWSSPPSATHRKAGQGLIDSGLSLLTFGGPRGVHDQLIRTYSGIDRIAACPVDHKDGTSGIAVGRTCYDAGVEVVGFSIDGVSAQNGPHESAMSALSELKLKGDACTVSALDLDLDGDNDLVVGTGFSFGMVPALVFLEAGKPVCLQPMTPRIGRTRALVLRDAAGTAYIAAATQAPLRFELERLREIEQEDRYPCPDCGGLRVWRAADVRRDETSEEQTLYLELGNAISLAQGTMDGTSILFACFRADHEILELKGYRVDASGVRPVFSAQMPDVPNTIPQIRCFDLNGDGNDELLLALDTGTLVFRLE